jgi:hypothetical protein
MFSYRAIAAGLCAVGTVKFKGEEQILVQQHLSQQWHQNQQQQGATTSPWQNMSHCVVKEKENEDAL